MATARLPIHRSDLTARWAILTLLCVGLLGSYYCYDIPTAINNQVRPSALACARPAPQAPLPRAPQPA